MKKSTLKQIIREEVQKLNEDAKEDAFNKSIAYMNKEIEKAIKNKDKKRIDFIGKIVKDTLKKMKVNEGFDVKSFFGNKNSKSVGFTTVDLKKRGKLLSIEHSGNMGNTIKDVDENLKLMKLPSIKELKKQFKVVKEEGSPDYLYTLQLTV